MLSQFCSLSTHRALPDSIHISGQILIFAFGSSFLEPGQLKKARQCQQPCTARLASAKPELQTNQYVSSIEYVPRSVRPVGI